MDRRKLIVATGAAAVAAVAGEGTAAAAGAAPNSTYDHARLVLNRVDAGLGLVDPAGLRRLLDRCYAQCLASPPRDPDADDLDAWARTRMVELCRTDSYAVAWTEVPQARTLLAFCLLAYSQHQGTVLPTIERSMQVPLTLRQLEPDFLAVLLAQIEQRSATSRGFASALRATSADLEGFIAEKVRESSSRGMAAMAEPSGMDALNFVVGMLVIISFYYWVRDRTK